MQFKAKYFTANVCLFLLVQITDVWSTGCELNSRSDFSNEQAVFIENDELLSTKDKQGVILIPVKGAITATCPGPNAFIKLKDRITDKKSIIAFCEGGQSFRSADPEWAGPFKDLRCSRPPYVTAEYNGQGCYNDSAIIQVGYRVDSTFYKLYEVCFDNITLSTRYVAHGLNPASRAYQVGRRPAFFASTFYQGVPIGKLYNLKRSQARFVELFGASLTEKYHTKKQFLNRGHLAANADFLLKSYQRGSFFYANVAPQWSRHNAGNWEALERGVRQLASDGNRTFSLFSGTHGVTTLPDEHGHMKELFLHTDENNNLAVPVPMYYYKVIYEPSSKSAVAFVTVNNPHYSPERLKELAFCPDLCRGAALPWLRWKPDDVSAGYSFCCDVTSFNSTVGHLPQLIVEGLLL